VEIDRMRRLLGKYGDRFLEKFFGDAEIERAEKLKDPVPFIASRFAAKEAFSKALGTGFTGFGLKDIVVLRSEGQPPRFLFSERFKRLFPDARQEDFSLSISHEKKHAVASVIWCER
jgi:holo-[acyl-carrier protein] synthase